MVKRFLNVICVVLLTLLVGWGGLSQPALALSDQQKTVMEVWRLVNRAYLDETFNHQNWWFLRDRTLRQPLQTWEQTYTAIQKMLAVLDDPYTRFLPPDQYQSLQTNTAGELLGVGLQIAKAEPDQRLLVIAPIAGSPAEQAGLQPQDEILEINGFPAESLSLDEAAARMRGPAGTIVTLKIRRTDLTPFEVNLHRERISLNPVFAELRSLPSPQAATAQSAYGYIRLGQFNGKAVGELVTALNRLEAAAAKGYILDLRNNPGGLLQAGIEIARLWVDQGTIVYTVNRQGMLESFEATGKALTDKPLVVLVNHGTASSSEILAGALQDNQRAQLVGETTFGKGLIQSLFDLNNGAGLAVTVAKYETPSHRDINRLGITPDLAVTADAITRDQVGTDADVQYKAAVNALQAAVSGEVMMGGVGNGDS